MLHCDRLVLHRKWLEARMERLRTNDRLGVKGI